MKDTSEITQAQVNPFVVTESSPAPLAPEDGSTWEEYLQVQAMNGSTLVHGRKSMLQLKHAIDSDTEPTAPMQLGSVTHVLLLEPDAFEKRYCVMPDYHLDPENLTGKPQQRSSSKNTKYVKDKRADFEKANPGKPIPDFHLDPENVTGPPQKRTDSKQTDYFKRKAREFYEAAKHDGLEVITREQYDTALAMIEAIRSKPNAAMWLNATDTRKEVTVVGEIEGVVCKGRIDVLHTAGLIDIKTADDCAVHSFSKKALNLGYIFKQAIHRELVKQMTGIELPVYYIVVESSPPYDCAVFEFTGGDEQLFDQELDKARVLLTKYKECLESDEWPGVDEGEDYVRFYPPNWAMEKQSIGGWGSSDANE